MEYRRTIAVVQRRAADRAKRREVDRPLRRPRSSRPLAASTYFFQGRRSTASSRTVSLKAPVDDDLEFRYSAQRVSPHGSRGTTVESPDPGSAGTLKPAYGFGGISSL